MTQKRIARAKRRDERIALLADAYMRKNYDDWDQYRDRVRRVIAADPHAIPRAALRPGQSWALSTALICEALASICERVKAEDAAERARGDEAGLM